MPSLGPVALRLWLWVTTAREREHAEDRDAIPRQVGSIGRRLDIGDYKVWPINGFYALVAQRFEDVLQQLSVELVVKPDQDPPWRRIGF
jgi:hypothetical protein